MANKLNMPLQKGRKRVRMRTRILILILLAVLVQLLTYLAVLIFGGEFRDLEEHSYRAIAEKAEGSSAYIRSELREKSVIVQEYAEQLDSAVAEVLEEHGASASQVRTDRELNDRIIESSAELVSGLLRRAGADEAYLILDADGLDADEDGDFSGAVLYLQAADSELSQENYDFYERALETARENSALTPSELGCWSRSSTAASGSAPGIKYSLPLIAEDGTVYGVLGIGLAGNTVLAGLPARESDCYVLGYSDSGESYDILAHSGSSYRTLLGSAGTLSVSGRVEDGVCRFAMATDAELLGSVQDMELYEQNSPYAGERWALIFVADRADALHSLLFLRQMLTVSVVLSLFAAMIVAIPGCGVIIKPLSSLSKLIKSKRKYNEVIRFQPSNIYEIDDITDAITQLQINVQEFSSQVSKMISVADVGLGTFMYDRTDDTVFVGQSLIKVLKLNLPQGEDITISRQEFLGSIENPEVRSLIAAGLGMGGGEVQGDRSEVYRISQPDGGLFWMRLGYTYSLNTAIGIVQDITDTMIEKSRIEYERDHDNLTGLLNRQAYSRRLEELFRDSDAMKIAAIVMIDLDNLKYVNDTYGHSFGDDYIKTTATVLKKFKEYGGIVARLSGDEFNVCLPGFSNREDARRIIADIRAELLQSNCLLADGTRYNIGASMGVSWYPDDADSRELLMKYADFAMYTVKHSSKGGIADFDSDAYAAASANLTDLEELDHIIEESRVRYAFQSIVSAKTGEIYGYEALMRVQSEIFRSPPELLNIAKTSARLHEIERLTWTRSLADFQVLADAGRVEKDAHLFVNSIANHKLDDEVVAALENSYPQLLERIVIEILENESADEESIAHKRQVVYGWGGQFALDDYGTGYNSEYALLSLQPNIIKIDRSIISNCDRDTARHMIIENLVKLARAKGILVLAEGVETEEELKTVIFCGVDFLQGYYLAKPTFDPKPIDPKLADTIRRLADEKGKEESS